MKVHWTDTARDHLQSLHAYIAQSSPEYAQRIVDRLTRRSQQIGNFPQSGRIVPEAEFPQIREVLEGPYRIIYYITHKSVIWRTQRLYCPYSERVSLALLSS